MGRTEICYTLSKFGETCNEICAGPLALPGTWLTLAADYA